MLTRSNVKLNNDYTYIRAVDPTTDENAGSGYAGGETWLNTVSGDSFSLSDPDQGTWVQIEEASDAKIDASLKGREYGLFKLTGKYFYRYRQERLEDYEGPDSLDREDFELLVMFCSVFAEWTVTNNGGDPVTSTIQSDDIAGDISDFLVGDWLEFHGSKRIDGLYEITAITADSITVEGDFQAQTDRFLAAVLSPTDDFCVAAGRMLWYDTFIRNKRSGLDGERIGTYSWTAGTLIGGVGYPEDIAGAFMQYMSASPGSTADYVS